jgi:hypothetical protein
MHRCAEGQSEFVAHMTQAPFGPQTLPGWFAQSAFAEHWTHTDKLVLHTGAAPEHWEFDVQPGMHVNVRGLQIGLDTPHWEFCRHATQRPPGEQNGASEGQSESAAHATHWPTF